MIVINIPGFKKITAPPPYAVVPTKPTDTHGTLWQEAIRRDGIVRKLYKECPYMPGDICEESDGNHYGKDIVIQNICKTYADLGKSYVWKDDNPLIVCAWCPDKKETFFCTTNYLKRTGTINNEC